MPLYIHQLKGWPHFTWDERALAPLLVETRQLQMRLLGRMQAVGFEMREEADLETVTLDVVRTSAIEGEVLDPEQLREGAVAGRCRRSIADPLNVEEGGETDTDRRYEATELAKIPRPQAPACQDDDAGERHEVGPDQDREPRQASGRDCAALPSGGQQRRQP